MIEFKKILSKIILNIFLVVGVLTPMINIVLFYCISQIWSIETIVMANFMFGCFTMGMFILYFNFILGLYNVYAVSTGIGFFIELSQLFSIIMMFISITSGIYYKYFYINIYRGFLSSMNSTDKTTICSLFGTGDSVTQSVPRQVNKITNYVDFISDRFGLVLLFVGINYLFQIITYTVYEYTVIEQKSRIDPNARNIKYENTNVGFNNECLKSKLVVSLREKPLINNNGMDSISQ